MVGELNQKTGGKLEGRCVAFTGKLLTMGRDEARRMVSEAGGRTTTTVSRRTSLLVVGLGGWPLLPTGEVSNSFRRAEELIERGVDLRIIPEDRFLEELGVRTPQPRDSKQYTKHEIAKLTGIEMKQLERWERQGLLPAGDGGFDYQDIVSLRTLAELLARGVRPETIAESLRGLSRVLPETARPLAQLKLIAEDPRSLVAEFDGSLVSPDGQLVLGFDEHPGDRPLAFDPARGQPVADDVDWFAEAEAFEEREDFEAAADAYRKAIADDPSGAEAFYNLGNVLRTLDRADAALELFRIAVTVDPDLSEAWYNIADILEESGDIDGAVDALNRAVTFRADFADAYYNLALCYEQLQVRDEARRCWSEYLKLDPSSDWANVARRHLATM